VGADAQESDDQMEISTYTGNDASLNSESLWIAVFGANSVDAVLADANAQNITPQDYTTASLLAAIDNGLDVDRMEAYNNLCRQLHIDVC
jgi:murein L,D-transpeptidase YcbB/YkuD